MSASRMVLWRHGQTDLNVDGRIQGSLDTPLNDRGREQARAAAARLVEYCPSVVVSSPQVRARSTAEALAEILGMDVVSDVRLKERNFGRWEGLNRDAIRREWPDQFEAWTSGRQPEGVGVETRSAVGERVGEAIEEWASGAAGTVVVVSHGAALACGVSRLLGSDPSHWTGLRGMDNCHWTVLMAQADRHPAWRIHSYNLGATGGC